MKTRQSKIPRFLGVDKRDHRPPCHPRPPHFTVCSITFALEDQSQCCSGKKHLALQSGFLFFWSDIIFRTAVTVLVISTLLIYRALTEDESKEAQSQRVRKLEDRVQELEALLRQSLGKPIDNKLDLLKPSVMHHNHPIDVKFLNYQDRKRILITGGAGFVGSHLTDKLMLAGHEVIVADNMFTGKD